MRRICLKNWFYMTKQSSRSRGLTLAELVMALSVVCIIMAAVATLSFAIGSADDSSDDTCQKQSQLRYATIRVGGLVRNARLICGYDAAEVAIWKEDSNGDNQINPAELCYLEAGCERNKLTLVEFEGGGAFASIAIPIETIKSGQARSYLPSICTVCSIDLISECSSVEFTVDTDTPYTKQLTIRFNLAENDVMRPYEINTSLRCWAGYLLDQTGELVSVDDD